MSICRPNYYSAKERREADRAMLRTQVPCDECDELFDSTELRWTYLLEDGGSEVCPDCFPDFEYDKY